MSVIGEYEKALDLISKNPEDEKLQNHLLTLTSEMDSLDAWDLESKIKTVLTKLNVTDFDKNKRAFWWTKEKSRLVQRFNISLRFACIR